MVKTCWLRVMCISFSLSLVLRSLHAVSVVSPLKVAEFVCELAGHPDQSAVSYVIDGLHQGFQLGFHPTLRLKSAKSNKPSARQHLSVIDHYLANQVSLHRVAGPFASPPFPNVHISSFGVIPKRGQRGKWHLVDLSSPSGYSINNGINPKAFSLQYIKVRLSSWLLSMGRGIAGKIWSRSSISQHCHAHWWSLLLRDEMEGQVFGWLSPAFWPQICSFYLQLCCRHGWMHPHSLTSCRRSAPLFQWLYYHRVSQFHSVCFQSANCLVCLPKIRSSSTPWQVCWPIDLAGHPRYWVRFSGAVRTSSRGKVSGFEGADHLLEPPLVVFPGSVGVSDRPLASRSKSGLVWAHVSSMDGRPSMLFPTPEPLHSFELWIPTGPSVGAYCIYPRIMCARV